MEGKELYNDDEELDPKSKNENSEDDFGLPDIEHDPESEDESKTDLGDPFEDKWEEPKQETDFASSDSSSDTFDSSTDETNEESFNDDLDHLAAEEEDHDGDFHSSYYEEEYNQKKFPVGWIIFSVFVVIAIIIGVFWWMNKDDSKPKVVEKSKPVVEQPIQQVEPEPEVVTEPEPEPEPVKAAGVYEINEPTGRYYVIVASSIDKDLVRDYANKLAGQGMSCSILAPRGKKKFHRLAVADFESLNDAALKAEQLKSDMGDEVWVIRY